MPIDQILGLPQSSAGWDIIKTLYTYYGINDYLRFNYYERFKKDRLREIYSFKNNPNIPGEKIFWRDIMLGDIQKYDNIALYGFQISPWFPRKPGIYWTNTAAMAREKAWQKHVESIDKKMIVFDVYGKTLMAELGGIGSVNLRKDRNNVLLTATASGFTDAGIPILCPSAIWKKIKQELDKNRHLEVDLKGTVEMIPLEYDSFFLRNPGLPKIAIYVGSILNIEFKVSTQSIKICPWTIFETDKSHSPYGFTYVTHDLFKNNFQNSVNWILDYIDKRNGTYILTDFDEETNSLNAKFPLNGCIDGTVFSDDVFRYCQKIKRKFERYL